MFGKGLWHAPGMSATASGSKHRVKPDHFGGPFGTLAMTFIMPAVSFYLWSSIAQHGGHLWRPRSLYELIAMVPMPTATAAAIFLIWLAVQAALYRFGPGKIAQGVPLADGTRLTYHINGLFAFIVSGGGLLILIRRGWFSAQSILDQLGPLLAVSTIAAFGFAAVSYQWGRQRGALERSSGSLFYDYYMGAILNPRIGDFDLKFFFESRMGMASWGALVLLMPIAELERHGHISTAMVVVTICQLFYVLDFFVFESLLLSMLDIIYENFGFMLWHGFLVWIPFNFTLQQQYILEQRPALSLGFALFVLALNFAGYAVFRDSNLQKQRFRRDPKRPVWGKPPVTLKTKRGTELLMSGWWGLARHTNYMGDLMMALSWCLACGFGSIVPYFYFIYFAPLLIDRERRDHALCKGKYGDDWDRYCQKVPYRMIPYIY